ncbi:MAG TPA: aspartyl protease family protein [Longimicrobium sp.]
MPFELHNGHVYVRVRADSAPPAWFILDTGASTTLDSAFAASLGRGVAAHTERGGGGGEGSVQVRFVEGVTLALADSGAGAARVPAQRIATVSLAAISRAEGRPVAGILGGSFFSRHGVVIDYARLRLTVHPTRTFRPPAEWTAIPLQREEDLVFARAAVTLRAGARPLTGWYEVDTGGGHALILNAPFAARHGLGAAGAGSSGAMLSIGGGATAVRGQVEAFTLGSSSLAAVPALFSQATGGLFASGDFDGSIGGALLSRFPTVAFDYAAKRMWLAPLPPASGAARP